MATNPGLVIELTNYSAFQREMKTLDKVLDNLDARLDRVVDVFDSLDQSVASSTRNLKKVFSVFRQANSVGNLANASTNLNAFFTTLKQLPSIMAGIRLGDINTLNKLFGSLKRFSGTSLNLPNVEGLGTFLESLARLSQVKDLSNTTGLVNSIKNVAKVFGELSQLGGRRQARFLFLRRRDEIKQLPQAIRGIADALRSLNLINPAAATAASSSLRAIRSLLVLMGSIDVPQGGLFRRKTRLTQLLIGIRPLSRLLVQVLKEFESLKGIANIRAVSSNFRALINLVKLFSDIDIDTAGFFRRKTRLTQFLVGIKPLAKLLRKSVEILSTANIKSPKNLNQITDTIKALTRIIDVANSGKAIDPNRAKNFGKSIRDIAKSLEQGFEQGDFEIDLEKQGEQAGEGFLSGIKRSLLISSPSRAMLRIAQQVGQGFVRGIQTLNPLRMGSRIGTLFIGGLRTSFEGLKSVITGVIRQFDRLRDGISQRVRDIGRSISDVGRNLFDSGLRTVATGGLIGFLQSRFIGDTADYQQILRQIEVFGSLTVDQVSMVDAELSKFSAATIFDPNQSAAAFLGLQKAGLDLTSALATLPEVGNLAAAAQLELADATDLTVRSANAFNIEFTDTKRVVDALVGAADISTAEVATLGQALGFVGNDANNLGISLEDTVAALALLNDKSIVGERAGTGLRAILSSLIAPTDEAQKTLDGLGISVFDAGGEFVGLENLITQFQGALDGMTTEQITSQLSALGDRNATSTLLALISAADDGSQAFANYRESLNTANTAAGVAEAQMDTFKGVVTSLGGSLVNLRNRALGPLLEKVLKPFGKEAIKLVNVIAGLPQEFLATAAGVGIAATAFITLLGVGQLLTGLFLLQLGPAISLVGGLFALIFNPVGAILGVLAMGAALAALLPILIALGTVSAIGLGALVTGIRDIQNNVGGAGDSLIALKDAVGELFSTVGGLIASFFEFVGVYRQVRDESRLFGEEANKNLPFVARFIDTLTAGVRRLTDGLNEARLFFQFFTDASNLLNGEIDSDGVAASERQNELLERRRQLLDQITRQTTAAGVSLDNYTVKSGDTLFDIAREFDTTVDDILAANPEITDRSLIFTGQELVIPGVTLAEGADDNLINELAEVEKQLQDELINGVKGRGRAAGIELSRIQRTFQQFANTSIFQRLFGNDPLALTHAVAAVGEIEQSFRRMGRASRRIGRGFRILFSRDFERGFNQIKLGFGQLSLELLGFGEQLFGFDLPQTIEEALAQGDLGRIVRSGFNALGRVVLGASEDIAHVAGQGFTFFLRRAFLGLPRLFLNLLGIHQFDPVFEAVDSIAQSAGNVLQSAISNVFGVLKGEQSVSDGITDFFTDVKTEIENNPILAAIADRLSFLDFSALGGKFSDFTTQIRDIITSPEFIQAKDAFLDFLSSLAGFGFTAGAFVAYTLASSGIDLLTAAAEQARPTLARITPILQVFGQRLDDLAAQISQVTARDDFPEIARNLTLLAGGIAAFAFLPGIVGTLVAVGGALGILLVAYLGFKTILDSVDSINLLFNGLKDFVVGVAELDLAQIGTGLGEILAGIAGIGFALLGNVVDIAADLATAILDLLNVDYDQGTIDAIKEFADNLIALGSVGSLDELLAKVRELFGVGPNGITFEQINDSLGDLFLGMIRVFLNILDGGINAIIDGINSLLSKFGIGEIEEVNLTAGIDETIAERQAARIERDLQRELEKIEVAASPGIILDDNAAEEAIAGLIDSFEKLEELSPDTTLANFRDIFRELGEAGIADRFNFADIVDFEDTDNLRAAFNAAETIGGDVFGAFLEELIAVRPDVARNFGVDLAEQVAAGTLDAASILESEDARVGEALRDGIDSMFDFATNTDNVQRKLDAAKAAILSGFGPEFNQEINDAIAAGLQSNVRDERTDAIELFLDLNPNAVIGDPTQFVADINAELNEAIQNQDAETVVDLLDLKVRVQQASVENPETVTLSDADRSLLEDALETGVTIDEDSPLSTAAKNSGIALTQGLADGMAENEAAVTTAATDTATAAQDALNTKLEIQSPSQWAIRTGGFLIDGFNLGIQAKLPLLLSNFDLLTSRIAMLDRQSQTSSARIRTAFTAAAISMLSNAQLIRTAADRMIQALSEIAFTAGNAAAAVNGVGGTGIGGTTSALAANTVAGQSLAGTALPTLPIPRFHSGGDTTPYAPSGRGEFLALLRGGEYVLSEQDLSALGQQWVGAPTGLTGPHPIASAFNTSSSSNNPTFIMQFQGDIVLPENTTGEVTPEQIGEGMELYFRQKPIQLKLQDSGR